MRFQFLLELFKINLPSRLRRRCDHSGSSGFLATIILIILALFSSITSAHVSRPAKAPKMEVIQEVLEPVVIRVTGYAAYTKPQDAKSEDEANAEDKGKRLLAIRASKLDAYRALAERIYGIGISGSSKVKDFALQSDSFGAVVDSYVRGARVVSILENKHTGIETVLEVLLPGDFQDCINKVNNFHYSYNCLRPFTQESVSKAMDAPAAKRSGAKMDSVYYLQ